MLWNKYLMNFKKIKNSVFWTETHLFYILIVIHLMLFMNIYKQLKNENVCIIMNAYIYIYIYIYI